AVHCELHSFPTRRSSDLTGARASFVAKDEEEVKLIIGNILASAAMEWLPTVDLPMIAMRKGVYPAPGEDCPEPAAPQAAGMLARDRKSTRLNSSHVKISY